MSGEIHCDRRRVHARTRERKGSGLDSLSCPTLGPDPSSNPSHLQVRILHNRHPCVCRRAARILAIAYKEDDHDGRGHLGEPRRRLIKQGKGSKSSRTRDRCELMARHGLVPRGLGTLTHDELSVCSWRLIDMILDDVRRAECRVSTFCRKMPCQASHFELCRSDLMPWWRGYSSQSHTGRR